MNNKKIILFLIPLLILFCALWKAFLDTNPKPKEPLPNKPVQEKIDAVKYHNFINEFNLHYLDHYNETFSKVSEIDNQAKLYLIYTLLEKETDFNKGVASSRFKIYNQVIFGQSTLLENENLDKILLYDKINDTYTFYPDYNKILKSIPFYTYEVKMKVNKSEANLKLNKFYYELKDNNYIIYDTYQNYENHTNQILVLSKDKYPEISMVKNYINDNYKTISSKITTYKYTFQKRNNAINLISYEKIKK